MNLIDRIDQINLESCEVYTTFKIGEYKYEALNSKIIRFVIKRNLWRYWLYVKFNLVTIFKLLRSKPSLIIVYETYSVFPLYIYTKLVPNVISIIHYHEYLSMAELQRSSVYFKLLNLFEKKLFKKVNYISHTNQDRIALFLKDYPNIKLQKMLLTPNYPPSNWYSVGKLKRKQYKNVNETIKLIHVGALSLNTMYTTELVNWVIGQNGKFIVDFYSNNVSEDAKLYFESLNNDYVKLHSSVNYFKLPDLLIEYDIGLTLYNGHIPNYVFNIPNKVYEYLACGLDVWYSKDLITTHKLNLKLGMTECQIERPRFLNFLGWNEKKLMKNDCSIFDIINNNNI